MALRILFILSLFLAAVALGIVGVQLIGLQPGRERATVEVPSTTITQPVTQPVPMASYLIAARRLPTGTLLRAEDVANQQVPLPELPEGAIRSDEDNRKLLIGSVVRNPIEPRAPIRSQDVVTPRERGFLAAVLRPGHRAISVAVDIVTGTSGLIWPGDLVDLILTQERAEEGVPSSRRTWAETVERRLRVIAVDQRITQGGDPAIALQPARSITLEVTPEGAERVAVASRLGRLSLVVRAQEDDATAEPPVAEHRPQTIFARDVSPALARDPDQGQRVRVIQGAQDREVTFR